MQAMSYQRTLQRKCNDQRKHVKYMTEVSRVEMMISYISKCKALLLIRDEDMVYAYMKI